jgi:CheY-like chemotaxis protein
MSKRILVVEDQPDSRQIIRDVFQTELTSGNGP